MAKQLYDREIDKNTDWGGDVSTGFIPVAGNRVQQFIKGSLDKKVGYFYPSEEGEYLAFADEDACSEYLATDNEELRSKLLLGRLKAGSGEIADDATKIELSVKINGETQAVSKPGDSVIVTYSYRLIYLNSNLDTGNLATVTIQVSRGNAIINLYQYVDVFSGENLLNITPDIGGVGTYLVKIIVRYGVASKTTATSITVFDLKLSAANNGISKLVNKLSLGGYTNNESVEFDYTLSGVVQNYPARVTAYLDGVEVSSREYTNSSTDNISVSTNGLLTNQMHHLQIVASVTKGAKTINSQTLIIQFPVGYTGKYVCLLMSNPSGDIIPTKDSELTVSTVQYDTNTINYFAYDPNNEQSTVEIGFRPIGQSAFVYETPRTVDREYISYDIRRTKQGQEQMSIRHHNDSSGSAQLLLDIQKSSVDISITENGLIAELTAVGRSNNEDNPAIWTSNGITTTFTDVDWNTSGWTGKSLKLINGAKAVINYEPFSGSNLTNTGSTVEITMTVRNGQDDEHSIISCYETSTIMEEVTENDSTIQRPKQIRKGLDITSSSIDYLTGVTLKYINEDKEEVEREIKLTTKYIQDKRIKITHVLNFSIRDEATNTLAATGITELYIDGNRTGAEVINISGAQLVLNPQPITIDSTYADIEIESIRIYNVALSDDLCLNNSIADEEINTMIVRNQDNDVMANGSISMEALQTKGKGVILIVREVTDPKYGTNALDDVYGTNDKKADFEANVYYKPSTLAASYGAQAFSLENCYIRIQGTSSTTYPAKNLRFYLNKGPKDLLGNIKTKLYLGKFTGITPGVDTPAAKNQYSLREGSIPQAVLCAKTDYSDSSMSLNTGGAKLFTDIFKELELLTPPLQYLKEHNLPINVRASIDGFPVDIFAATSLSDTPVYYGQYNLNNEKSKSGKIFGMELEGFNPTCPIALETLNNGTKPTLFLIEQDNINDLINHLNTVVNDNVALKDKLSYFDEAFEINYCSQGADGDVVWSNVALKSDKVNLQDSTKQKIAQWLLWIGLCYREIVSRLGRAPRSDTISDWYCDKFTNEVDLHFAKNYMLTYYVWTDYFLAVDQRAKNILWRTWDGDIWYPTYYDGDTLMGKRNDCYLVYDYWTERDTYDYQRNKYAFEGHESWLWNMCLANLNSEMAECARNLREKMVNIVVENMLLTEQTGNWADRVFNKSGFIKYIKPAVFPGLYSNESNKIWPYIYALQGANRSHREYFILNRFDLLDAKYGCTEFTGEKNSGKFNCAGNNVNANIKIKPSLLYVFGYGTVHRPNLGSTGLVNPTDYTDTWVNLNIRGTLQNSDPILVYGIPRIKLLDLSSFSKYIAGGVDLSKASSLVYLNLSKLPDDNASSEIKMLLPSSARLVTLLAAGQTNIGISNVNPINGWIDVSTQTRLETLDLSNTGVTNLILPEGGVIDVLKVPTTLTILNLKNLPKLKYSPDSNTGLLYDNNDLSNLSMFEFKNCPLFNIKQFLSDWVDQAEEIGSVKLYNINWTGNNTLSDESFLIKLILKCNLIEIEGRIEISGPLSNDTKLLFKSKLGENCFALSGKLYIEYLDINNIVITAATHPNEVYALQNSAKSNNNYFINHNYITIDDLQAITSFAPQGDVSKWKDLDFSLLRYCDTSKIDSIPYSMFENGRTYSKIYYPERYGFPLPLEAINEVTFCGSNGGNRIVSNSSTAVNAPNTTLIFECDPGDTLDLHKTYMIVKELIFANDNPITLSSGFFSNGTFTSHNFVLRDNISLVHYARWGDNLKGIEKLVLGRTICTSHLVYESLLSLADLEYIFLNSDTVNFIDLTQFVYNDTRKCGENTIAQGRKVHIYVKNVTVQNQVLERLKLNLGEEYALNNYIVHIEGNMDLMPALTESFDDFFERITNNENIFD